MHSFSENEQSVSALGQEARSSNLLVVSSTTSASTRFKTKGKVMPYSSSYHFSAELIETYPIKGCPPYSMHRKKASE